MCMNCKQFSINLSPDFNWILFLFSACNLEFQIWRHTLIWPLIWHFCSTFIAYLFQWLGNINCTTWEIIFLVDKLAFDLFWYLLCYSKIWSLRFFTCPLFSITITLSNTKRKTALGELRVFCQHVLLEKCLILHWVAVRLDSHSQPWLRFGVFCLFNFF